MKQHSQRGGTATGFIIGLVIGLAVALAVAIYVTKVPTPFTNKNQPRSADQDAAEAQKNKDWNPNGALQSKPAGGAADASEVGSGNDAAKDAAKEPLIKEPVKEAVKEPIKEAAKEAAKEVAKPDPRPAVTADPLGELVKAKTAPTPTPNPTATGTGDPFTYFVQAGDFRSQTEADAQRAKLTMMGLDAKISEREQAGRQVYRVRLGPFDDKDVAERAKSKLDAGGIETALVRVQR
jgi:cell division protein FtsN